MKNKHRISIQYELCKEDTSPQTLLVGVRLKKGSEWNPDAEIVAINERGVNRAPKGSQFVIGYACTPICTIGRVAL